MTVRQALKQAEDVLLRAGVPNARLDAEYLLAEVLHSPRLLVCLSGETQVADTHLEEYFSLVARRERREPLQYILGTQPFMGFDFDVNGDVLIPRADTETLCEQAVLYASGACRVLDLCTGSGALATAIALLCPSAQVSASDLSENALSVARHNAEKLGASVTFYQGDLFVPLRGQTFDLIVSNPPYVPDGEIASLQEEVLREPRMALAGGADGLNFYRRIAQDAPAFLVPGGRLLLEIGDTQAADVSALLSESFTDIAVIRDLSGHDRVVSAVKKGWDRD